MSFLLYATPSFLFVTICPATLIFFALRRVSGPPIRGFSAKTTDFYATLLFGVFMTLAGAFGIVAESLVSPGARWWTSAAFAMQTLSTLIGQLAVIQLLTPDYLFDLLSVNAPSDALPSWRIYALILTTLVASIISIISAFVVSQTPSLPESLPTLVSLSLPLPHLFSLARIAKVSQLSEPAEPRVATVCTKPSSECTDLELSATVHHLRSTTPRFPRIWVSALALQSIGVLGVAGEVVEGVLGHRMPVIRLLSALGLITWGGGIMTIHFIIIYEPTHKPPTIPSVSLISEPSHDLEHVTDQPSEDCMTLKDPFASSTQSGFPLPPSPPRGAHRKPRRRASEPLQLRRFGSFAVLAEDVKERQAGTEEDQHTQFLEELVRHAWFSTGGTDSDSTQNNSHECGMPPSIPIQIEQDVFTVIPTDESGSPTPTIRKESQGGPEAVSPSILRLHSFRPVTPPRPICPSPWAAHRRSDFSEPHAPLPLSPPLSVAPVRSSPQGASADSSAYAASPSSGSSDSGSSFVSPPPTPTPISSRRYPRGKELVLAPIKPLAFLGSPDQCRGPVYP